MAQMYARNRQQKPPRYISHRKKKRCLCNRNAFLPCPFSPPLPTYRSDPLGSLSRKNIVDINFASALFPSLTFIIQSTVPP